MDAQDRFTKIRRIAEELDKIFDDFDKEGTAFFGIISDIDGDGISVTAVTGDDDAGYWQKVSMALSCILADTGGDKGAMLLTSVLAALTDACLRSAAVREAVRYAGLPKLAEACGIGHGGAAGKRSGGLPS